MDWILAKPGARAFALWSLVLCAFVAAVSGGDGGIQVVKVDGAINPGVAAFIQRAVRDADRAGAECLVIELDTPGGLAESMRLIVKTIMDSPVPVVVYVAPSGARAASAGVMITIAAHVAAMAPGTNIGAAHPVTIGREMEETMAAKVTNDMVANVRSIAKERGRNEEWVEKAVRESVSATADEALSLGVVDLTAATLDQLLEMIDGRKVKVGGVERTLQTKDKPVTYVRERVREKILRTISDPNIAYILMMLGLVGLYFELSNPGALFPGIIGAIALILAFYAFQTLPVNYAGILLILLGVVLFILEIKVASMGLLSVGGVVCLILGSLFLFKDDEMGIVRVSWEVLLPTVVAVTLFFTVIVALIVRAMMRRPTTGVSGLIGEVGRVVLAVPGGETKVFVHGETWNAESAESLSAGDQVEVAGMEQFRLKVKKILPKVD